MSKGEESMGKTERDGESDEESHPTRAGMIIEEGAHSRIVEMASVVVLLAGMKFSSSLLVLVLGALFIAIVSEPLVNWLTRRGAPHGAAVGGATFLHLLLFMIFGVVAGQSINRLYDRLPVYRERLGSLVESLAGWLSKNFAPVKADDLYGVLDPGQMFSALGEALTGVAGFISNTALVLLIVAFLLFESVGLREKLRRTVLHSDGAQLDPIDETSREVQKYLIVKTVASLATGVILGAWNAVLGVDFAILWGTIAFLFNYVPAIGSIVAGLPPTLVALAMHGPGVALAVMFGYGMVNFAIGNVIEPRVMGRTLGLSPVVVLLSILFWGWILGPIGAILSVPMTMVIRIVLSNIEEFAWVAVLLGPSPEPEESDEGDPDGVLAEAGDRARIGAFDEE